MNRPSRQLLEKLLHAWQGNPDRSRKVRLHITSKKALPYFEAVLPDAKEALHAGLEEAAASGAVTLEWGKGYDRHILEWLTLEDGPALASYLGVPLAATLAGDARSVLESLLSGRESWISDWLQKLLERWSRNQMYCRLAPGDLMRAGWLISSLEAVAACRQVNLDLRTFSIRELGSSKALESILPRFVSVWKEYHPSGLRNNELLQTLGLVKFPLPLLLRGPVTLKLAGRDLGCAGLAPFVGLPPQAIRGLSTDRLPAYVLTIENLASFNRYTAEIEDEGLVLYSAGFPSPGVAGFLRLLDASLPGGVAFFHWGDIDEGGLKIFCYIQGLLGRTLRPHLMTAELLKGRGQAKPGLRAKEVRLVSESESVIAFLAKAILLTDPPVILEQENVDPLPPEYQAENH